MCYAAAAGAVIGLTLGTMSLVARQQQQEDLNESIEEMYQQDLKNARAQANLQLEMKEEETISANTKNAQERRNDALDALKINAEGEAAMSALNIAGNTAMRETGVADVSTIRREGAYDAREDTIQTQHLMDTLGIREQYDNAVQNAYAKGMNAWQPVGGSVLSNILGIAGSTIQGAATGASLGSSMSGLFGSGASSLSAVSFDNGTTGISGSAGMDHVNSLYNMHTGVQGLKVNSLSLG